MTARTWGAGGLGGAGEGLLAPAAAAAWLQVTPKVLERWRTSGGGPPFVRLSRKIIRYRISDLTAFVDSRVCSSTAR